MPNLDLSQCIRIPCSIVSKEADRLSGNKATVHQLSNGLQYVMWTFRRIRCYGGAYRQIAKIHHDYIIINIVNKLNGQHFLDYLRSRGQIWDGESFKVIKIKVGLIWEGYNQNRFKVQGINTVSREEFTRTVMTGRRTGSYPVRTDLMHWRGNLARFENSDYIRGRNSSRGCCSHWQDIDGVVE